MSDQLNAIITKMFVGNVLKLMDEEKEVRNFGKTVLRAKCH